MRQRRAWVVLVVALITALTACTDGSDSPSGPSSPGPSPSASASDDTVSLRLAVYGDQDTLRAYRRMARAFMRKKPDVEVSLETSPSKTAAWARLQRDFADGDPPDLFLAESSRLTDLMEQGEVQPVDELLEKRNVQFGDHFERLGLEAFAADSALQCMPDDVSPLVVYYNMLKVDVSSLDEPGQRPLAPQRHGWSWDDFSAAAQEASQGRVKGAYLPPQLDVLAPLVRSAGADIIDDPQKPTTLTFTDKAAKPTLDKIVELTSDRAFTPTRSQVADGRALRMFERGRLAMMVGTRAMVPELRKHPNLTFDVYPLPSFGRFTTTAQVTGYCLSSKTQHRNAAADLLTFATSDEGSRITVAAGSIVPANLDVRASADFLQRDRFPVSASVFSRVLRRAETLPDPPGWDEVVQRSEPMLERAFEQPGADVDELFARLDQLSEDVLMDATQTPSPSEGPSPSATPSAGDSSSGTG